MAQGFVNSIPLPLRVAQGGTGGSTSTGTVALVSKQSPTIKQSNIVGVTNGSDAAAGSVGEYASSVIAFASGVNIPNTTATNLTSLSLTAGDWDLYGNVNFVYSANNGAQADIAITTVSATLPDTSLRNLLLKTTGGFGTYGVPAPSKRISIAATTTVYLVAYCFFTGGTCSINGGLFARRTR